MKKILYPVFVLPLVVLVAGCGILSTASLVGHMAGGEVEGKSIAYNFETSLTSKSTIISAYKKVGSELGWEMTTESPDLIIWKVSGSSRADEYFGKYSETSLYASVMPNGNNSNTLSLQLSASISGNYNEASKENVDRTITEFENRLREHLKESGHTLNKVE